MPTLKIPAYPHWIFIPKAITADIMHIFKIERLRDQDWPNPTNKNNITITPIANISFLLVLFIKSFL